MSESAWRAPEERGLDARAIVESSSGPALATDEAGRIRHWNEGAEQLLGYTREWVRRRSLVRLLDPRDVRGNPFEGGRLLVWDMLGRGETGRPFEVSLRPATGGRVRANVSLVVVAEDGSGDGEIVYLLEPMLRRRRSDEVIDELLTGRDWSELRAAPGAVGAPKALAVVAAGSGAHVSEADSAEAPELTPRQLEVLRLLAGGRSAQEIARKLGISPHTVRSHRKSLFAKLGAHSQIEAVAIAHRHHLI